MPEQTPTTGSNNSNKAPSRFKGTVRSILSTSRHSVQPQSAAGDPAQQSRGDPPSSNAASDSPSTKRPPSSRLTKWFRRAHRETASSNSNENSDNRVRNNDKRAYVSEIDAKGQEIPGTEVRAAYPDAITSVPSKASRAHPQGNGKGRDPNNLYCFNYE